MLLGDGPIVTGTWYNPKTGHSFTAKDTYFEDDKMYVLTTDGQRLDYNMLSQYVQSNNPVQDKKDFGNKPQNAQAVLPPEVAAVVLPPAGAQEPKQPDNLDDSLLTPEDRALIYGSNDQPGVIASRPELNIPLQAPAQEDEDDLLVRRLLKRSVGPTIDCNIRFERFPQEQLHMLEMMGVDPEKIANYYIKDVTLANIQEIIRVSLIEVIEKMMAKPVKPDFIKIAEPAVLTQEQSMELGLDSLESLIPEAQINEKEKPVVIKKAPVKTAKKTTTKKKTPAKKTTKK